MCWYCKEVLAMARRILQTETKIRKNGLASDWISVARPLSLHQGGEGLNILEELWYLTRPEVILSPQIGNYKDVICEYRKHQCRVRENEIRRQKRAAERAKQNQK